jgi:hypothetical protein
MTPEVENILRTVYKDRDPVRLLGRLAAKISYRGEYYIPLSDSDREQIHEILKWFEAAKYGDQN